MLDLQDGGRCMSGPDAVEFFEKLADVIDDEAKTEEFCDEYTWALNRMRCEVRQSVPVRPKKKGKRITYYTCGQCGHGVGYGDNYCNECGRKIDWR